MRISRFSNSFQLAGGISRTSGIYANLFILKPKELIEPWFTGKGFKLISPPAPWIIMFFDSIRFKSHIGGYLLFFWGVKNIRETLY